VGNMFNPSAIGPGTYELTYWVENEFGCDATTEVDVVVVELNVADADYSWEAFGTIVEFENLSINGEEYSWNFGDGDTSTQFQPVHTYAGPGLYLTQLVIFGNCGEIDTALSLVSIFPQGVASSWLLESQPFPNPANSLLRIEDVHSGYELFDAKGKRSLIFSRRNGRYQEFNTSHLSNGIYYLKQISKSNKCFKVEIIH